MDDGVSERTEGGSADFGRWWTATSLWSIVLLGSFLLNGTLLVAFIKRPGLRTISNRFVMNLTASNLLTCALLIPLLVVDAFPSSSTASLCALSEGASALVTASSVLSVLLIAVDQYFAVVDPLRYRTRIDKLKCGILIISIWVISILFGFLATFNPSPRSLWLCCQTHGNISHNATLALSISSRNLIDNNETNFYDVEQNVSNSTAFREGTFPEQSSDEDALSFHVSYGLVYTLVHSVLVYLLPFLGVCWIYISIYSAAHKNSERARRTGSGPMLSSPSFCEEYGTVRHDFSTEDFRRIPKISSLSSIDESIETSSGQLPRRKSELVLSSSIEEAPLGVVFTVGLQKVDVSPRKDAKELTKVPTSTLKAEFLRKREEGRFLDEQVRSRFRDGPDDRRKSSHDLMYEAMLRRDLGEDPEDSSDEEHNVLTFSKNRRLEDIEVSKCQNSSIPLMQSQNKAPELTPRQKANGVLSRAALENHNLKSKQNGKSISRLLNEQLAPCTGTYLEVDASGRLLSSSTSAPMVTVTPPNRIPLHRVSSIRSTSSYINSLKYRISNGSLFKYREETRAARISALVIVMGLICWTPYVVLANIRNMPRYDVPHRYDVLALGFLILAAYVSPLLFGYRSRRVKRELRKIFCFKKELSYKNNRSLMAKKVLKRRHSSNLSQLEMDGKYNIFNCVYGKSKWPKEKVQFMQVPETALAVETCRSSFSSGASTQISTTSTEE